MINLSIRRYSLLLLTLCLTTLFASAQIFYKVEGNGLEKPSYIFGTHHLAPISILNQFDSLRSAMDSTEAVVGEIDMTQGQMQMAMEMQPYMMASSDSTLTALLSPEEFAALNEKFKPYAPMPGMDLAAFAAMRPMVVSSMVTLSMIQESMPGFNPAEQLDSFFQQSFAENGKDIIALETPAQQAKLLYTNIPISSQLDDLKELLENPAEALKMAEEVNEAYKSQNLDSLYSLTMSEESHPEFMKALLSDRNDAWMTKLPTLMAERPVMVVVGALHLAGPVGIVAQLRNKGFTVSEIK